MKRLVLTTPSLRDELHHLAETSRQVAERIAVLELQAQWFIGDERLEVERRVLHRRALRLRRLVIANAREVERKLTAHKKAQFKKAKTAEQEGESGWTARLM